MIIASLLSAACMGIGFLAFAISTLTPLFNMGVMTMKMMSITSITSTIGVTLISATGGGALVFRHSSVPAFFIMADSPVLLTCAALRPLQEVVDQFGAGVPHLDVECLDLLSEEVEHPHRGDGHEQTDSGRHQGFR